MLNERSQQLIIAKENPLTLQHSLRTVVAAVVSLLVARLFRLPETYWAAISTLIVMQSNLGAAFPISAQRFIGSAVGALVGAIVASQIGPNVLVFGACVFILGLLCALVGPEGPPYRFGGVTLAIVLLLPRTYSVWHVAFHRFVEVSIGIGVAFVLTILWPESTKYPASSLGFEEKI